MPSTIRTPSASLRALTLAALVVFAGADQAGGQLHNFRNLTGVDGLPQAQVLAIHQDARQYLWVATYGGLSRYGGADFRTIGTAQGLTSNTITSIAEDADGRIVVGSIGGGMCTWDGSVAECLGEADGLPHRDVLDVLVDADGRSIWLATRGGVARVAEGRVRAYGVEDGAPGTIAHRLERGRDGDLWVGGDQGLARWNGAGFVAAFADQLGEAAVTVLRQTPFGLLVGAGTSLYLARDGVLQLLTLPELPPRSMISDADVDANGAVWISTRRAGVLRYDGTTFERYTSENGLLFDQVNRVRVDREGNVWFGTERGLSRLTPGPFRSYSEREGLPNSFVRAISADRYGRIWLGTRDGVAIREGDRFRALDMRPLLADRRVYALAPVPEGGMLIGTQLGVAHHDGSKLRGLYGQVEGLPGSAVFALLADGEAGVWIGTSNGLARWRDGRITRIEGFPELENTFVVSLALDAEGRLWVGARSGGVLVFDGRTVTRLGPDQGLTDQTIWAIAMGSDSVMWIGSNGGGAFRVAGGDPTDIRRFTTDTGLVDNFVWQVQPDREGHIWLYTNRGIDRVSPTEIRHYSRGSGLLELEGAANASWLDSDGHLWFGTSVSVVRYAPELDQPAPLPPPIYIEEITVGDQELGMEGARFRGSDGVLKIRFGSPTFRDESAIRYRYRMLGTGEGWSSATAERSIGYAGLGPGQYEFQVYAIDPDGGTSERPATFTFNVTPPFWQAWWFRVLAGLVLLSGAAAAVLLRTRVLERERRRLGHLVAERTRELSLKNDALEREVAERERAEDALRSSQQRLQEIIEHSTNLFYSHTAEGVLTYVSPQSRRILGCEPEEALVRFHEFVTRNPENQLGLASTQRAIETGEKQPAYALELKGKDGIKRWVEVNEAPVIRDGRTIGIVGSLTDITESRLAATEQERLEAQLRQAQKMEAVGRLAGGIAHDFNNLLTAVVGNTELVASGLDADHPLQMELAQVKCAADRAASLVAQLLAFSRQQLIRRRVLDLNAVIGDSARMVRRMIGTDIELELDLASGPQLIEADQSQLDQVLINLALNARDAMPDGGRLTVTTRPVEIGASAQTTLDEDLPPGPYVALRIKDTGHGMDPETARHVFEPFFTTKSVGKGTGLGLATVYGIVTQNGGGIRIDSKPGKGTTFHIILPRARGQVESEPANNAESAEAPAPEGGVILVVEDEDAVRLLVRRTLERFGFTVLPAENGAVALQLCHEHAGEIDLLLTDMVMPGLNGREVAQQVTAMRPGVRVLYMSGHTREVLGSRFMLDENTQIVQKPFAPLDLVKRVRESLTATGAAAANV